MKMRCVLSLAAALLIVSGAWAKENEGGAPEVKPPKVAKEKEKERGPKAVVLKGELTAVEANSITVTQKGDKGARGTTVAVGADTQVLTETAEDEAAPAEHGETKQKPKTVEGTLADLKVGQWVTVWCTADGAAAVKVLVRRPPPPKAHKEHDADPGPKPPKPAEE